MDPHFDGVIFKTHPQELERRMSFEHPPFLLIDVRPDSERRSASIAGSIALAASDLTELPEGTTPGTEFFIVGADHYDEDVRAAAMRLRELGALRVVELAGGMYEWIAEGKDTAPASAAA
jgi:rhodanese-related sulfurtransferase